MTWLEIKTNGEKSGKARGKIFEPISLLTKAKRSWGVNGGGRTGNGTECQNTPQKRTNQEIMIRTQIVTNQSAQDTLVPGM